MPWASIGKGVMVLGELINKNPLIFGAGRSGVSAFKLIQNKGGKPTLVSSGDPTLWGASLSSSNGLVAQEDANVADYFQQASLIVLSPGIARDHKLIVDNVSPKIPIINEIDLAYYFLKIPVVAVTGTNGKTTTVTLLQEMAKAANKNIFVGGNIGIPFSEAVMQNTNYKAAILELSSFQLESLFSLRLKEAAILNITPGHGERYTSSGDYGDAKFRILDLLEDGAKLLVPKEEDENGIVRRSTALLNNKKLSYFSLKSKELLAILNKQFVMDNFQLPGEHNIINLYVAHKLASKLDIAVSAQQEVINKFKGVEHRLELLHKDEDLCIFNDSKSTNWASTITALHSLAQLRTKYSQFVIIVGGKKRGQNDSILPYVSEFQVMCDKIIFFGEVGLDLYKEAQKVGLNVEFALKLNDAINMWTDDSNKKGLLLFSPGFPSFDQFSSYAARGDSFKKMVL